MSGPEDFGARRSRKLREEEIALWIEVARSIRARHGAMLPRVEGHPQPPPPPKPVKPAVAPPPAPKPRSGPPPLAPIERRLKRDLNRGSASPDGVIDLHGMTQAQAHGALRGFLAHSQARGAKLVIVITGKGQSKPLDSGAFWHDEPGVLRRVVPHWLRAPELRGIVLGFEEAGPGQGGAGALYVRLRRRDRAS
jgi:DNA-nicking Smr family endonuclease